MKHALYILLSGFQLLFPFGASAEYEICLKNGRTLLVDSYWEEKNGQMKARGNWGVIGLNKNFIREIRNVSVSHSLKALHPPASVSIAGPTGNVPPEKSEQRGDSEKLRQKFLEEKNRILAGISERSAAFREAKQNEEKEKAVTQWKDLIRLHNELERLRSDVMKNNNGYLPDWWKYPDDESAN